MRLNGTADKFKKTVSSLVAYIGISKLAKNMLETSASFERFETALTTILGSSEKASSAMSWITNFTAKTPYELQEVTEAFIRLSARGYDATKFLEMLGDTAASMGKRLLDAVEMFTDATTGEFERLKEFGVRASVVGNQVTFSWVENGKQMSVTVNKTQEAISQALAQIFSRFHGGMARFSHTWTGMWSNLQDAWTEFQKEIMSAGVFNWLKARLENVLKQFERLKSTGELKRYAENIANAITDILNVLQKLGGQLMIFLNILSPFLPALIKYIFYLKLLKFSFATIIGLPLELYREFIALREALQALQIINLLNWLSDLRVALASVAIQASATALAFKGALALGAAWGVMQIAHLINIIWQWRKANNSLKESEQGLAFAQHKLETSLKRVANQLGKTSLNLKEFKKLVKEGKIVFDQTTKSWKWAKNTLHQLGNEAQKTSQKLTIDKWKTYAQVVLDSLKKAKQGLDAQIQQVKQYANNVKSALNEAIQKHKELKDKLNNINQEISDNEINTQNLIREAYRETMSDQERAIDKYREALSLLHKSQEMIARDPQKAKDLAKTAQSMFSELDSKYVGFQQKIEGIKTSGEIVKQALIKQKEAVLSQLDEQDKRVKVLQARLTSLNAQIDSLVQKKIFVNIQITKLEEALQGTSALTRGLDKITATQYGINLDDTSLNIAIQNAQKLLQLLQSINNTNVQVNFLGKASPIRPLGETISNIHNKLAKLGGFKDIVLLFAMSPPFLHLPSYTFNQPLLTTQNVTERVAVDLNINGNTYPLEGNKDIVKEFLRTLKKHRLRTGF